MSKRKMIIIITIILIFALLGIGILLVSYGYVTSDILNKDGKGKYFVVENLRIEYSDGIETLISDQTDSFIPGSTLTKTFTVKNTGSKDINYNIKFTNIINSFNRKSDLIYELYKEDTLVNDGIFPEETVSYMVGDLNSDNIIDYNDYNLLHNFFNNNGTLTQMQMIIADLNLDNTIDENDSPELISAYISSLEKKDDETNENVELLNTNIGKEKVTKNIKTIIENQFLKVNESATYTLKINYLTSTENQIEDSGKSINAKISFEQTN